MENPTQPPYSLDIARSDYHLFQLMANGLAEQHCHSYEDAKKCVHSWITFQRSIQMLP